MLDAVSAAIQDVPAFEEAYRRVYPSATPSEASSSTSGDSSPWSDTLRNATATLQTLHRELNEEVLLVIGAATLQESDVSARRAERANLFALVVVVYLPLTLVASVFGMNIKEIGAGRWTYRACLLGLAVVIGGTVLFAWACRKWRRWRREREAWPTVFDRHLKYA